MPDQSSPIPAPPHAPPGPGFPVWPLVVIGVLMFTTIIAAGTAIFLWIDANMVAYEPEEVHEELGEVFTGQVNAIRDAGLPVSAEELQSWYPPIEGPNAADAIYSAIEEMGDAEESANRTDIFLELRNEYAYESPPAEVLREIHEALAHFEPSVSLLRSTLDMEHARFDVDFTATVEIEHKHLAPYSRYMRLVHLSADDAIGRGAGDEAADWVLCGLRITKFVNEVPLMRSFTRTYSERMEIIQTLRRTLSQGAFPRENLERLQAEFESIDPVENLRRALIGQRALGISLITMTDGDPPGTLSSVCMLEFYEEALKDLDGELPERHSFEILGGFGGRSPPGHLMLGQAHRLLFRAKSDLAFCRMAITVLAIERYRADHGRVPESLDDLAGDYLDGAPIDPFDGHPLRYGLHSDAYFVYSVWADGQDGGGEMQVLGRNEDAAGDQVLYINRGLN